MLRVSTNSDDCYELRISTVTACLLISQRLQRSAFFLDVSLLTYLFFLFFILSMGKRRSAQTAWMLTSLTLTSRSWTPVILTQWTASVSCIGATSTQINPLHPYSTVPETQSYLRWEPSSVLPLLCTYRLICKFSGYSKSSIFVLGLFLDGQQSQQSSVGPCPKWCALCCSLIAFVCSLPNKTLRISSWRVEGTIWERL